MKRTQWTYLFRDIKKTFVSFVSIALFVALGIAVFLGIKWNEPAMANAVNQYLQLHAFRDYLLVFPYGITEADLAQIRQTVGVESAEGAYSAYGTSKIDGDKCVLHVQSLTESIDVATVKEGTMPALENEIGIDPLLAKQKGIGVGDTLEIFAEQNGTSCLKEAQFTVTAIMEHPAYFQNENDYSRGYTTLGDGSVDFFILAPKQAFHTEAYDNCYSEVLVRGSGLAALNSFSKEYEEKSAAILSKITALGKQRAEQRYNDVVSRMSQAIRDAEAQLNEKRTELKETREQANLLLANMRTLYDLVYTYNEDHSDVNKQALAEQIVQLLEDHPEIIPAVEMSIELLDEKLDLYIENSPELTAEEREIIESILDTAQLEKDEAGVDQLKMYLNFAREILQSYQSDPEGTLESLLDLLPYFLPQAETFLSEKIAEVEARIALLDEAIAKLDAVLGAAEEGEATTVNAVFVLFPTLTASETEEGPAQLDEAIAKLTDAKETLASMKQYDNWTVQKRTDTPSYATVKFYSESSRKLCYTMSLLFILVAIMVCYTSVSRSVNESETLTGVQKANGFRKGEIFAHFLLYSALAVAIGIVAGCLLGYFGIENIVNHAYTKLFALGSIPPAFHVPDAIYVSLLEILFIFAATWIPCRKLLKRPAVELLRGTGTTAGKTRFYEKTKLWKRMSLYSQTTVNNLVNDKARVIATLVGVAGCTALIIMSMSLQMAIVQTPKKHFSNVWTYDAALVADESVSDAHDSLQSVLDSEGADYASVLRTIGYIQDENGNLTKTDLIVPESTENFGSFMHLQDYKSKKTLPLTESGVIVSRTYQKHHNVEIGGEITLLDPSGNTYTLVVSGVSEHYLSTVQLTMHRDYYEQVFAKELQPNTFFLRYGDTDADALATRLQALDGYFSLTDEYARWTAKFAELSGTTTLIVYIGLSLSVAMALLVLLNLNIVCVNEKKSELVIMRINGFSKSDTKKYVYRDNILLTVLGICIGLVFGMASGVWILDILQKVGDNYYTVPSPISCLVGIGLTVLFAIFTNWIALRKVDKLKASDLKK